VLKPVKVGVHDIAAGKSGGFPYEIDQESIVALAMVFGTIVIVVLGAE